MKWVFRGYRGYHLHVGSADQRPRDPEDRLSTRREILAATERLLRRHPYSALTAEALAAEAGITTGELAEHFEDVTEVVLSLLTEMGLELYGVAERWLQDAQIEQEAELGFNAAARVWLRAIVDFFYRNGPIVRRLSEASLSDERIARAYNGFLDRFTELTAFGLDRMMTDGRIEPLDPWPVARALNLMNERYLLAEFGHGQQGNPEAALKTLETVWLRAFAPTATERRAR
jgi:TetR/AcrR family transcriptional regulator, ethionamide resistance regulator